MKWRNVDIGAGCYYITGTFTEWLPLMYNQQVRETVCSCVTQALNRHDAIISAYVLMPDHLHMLIYLRKDYTLHKFCQQWRGASGRRIVHLLQDRHDERTLRIMARHANGGARHAVWKEQFRSLPITSEGKYQVMSDYIHNNPVRRGLVPAADEWAWSSLPFYMHGTPSLLPVMPIGAQSEP